MQQAFDERKRDTHTIYIESLDDNLQLHLIGHVAQRAHGHPQLLLWDEAIPISVKYFERLTDLCWEKKGRNNVTLCWEEGDIAYDFTMWATVGWLS